MDSAQRKGNFVSVSPSQTPKSGRDHRANDANGFSNSRHDKDKGVNVQVILRCKPLSEDEKRLNTPVVVSCNEHRREVSAVQSVANKIIDKTFNFDRVFGPSSQQEDLFNLAVSPIVNEVLDGYNCTIFAYGQTGTGKTYTMEGGRKAKNGEFPNDAGVIPRAVRQIFETLEAQNAEYNMKVTFLELYNEEITDLLAPDELKIMDDKSKKPIALMEDGKGGVFVRGLEEEMVSSANEIYKILDKGSSKRRTAETLLNKQSSRSHSIFSITIHIKEYTHEGEEMIKCGKLNLVDLAGSENISRSGAREGRAREAGEINKSLLTLGRVINALVDHSGHIPYRDSKLTRLLRDSLGGKTKTCIIATVSPSIHCLEETLNTLDYAHRAKSIKNRPEINQKVLKSAMMKDLCCEINRLKQELYAAREKNGIYMPRDRFLQEEAEKKAMAEKIEHLELDLEIKDKKLIGLQELYNSQQLLTSELSNMLEETQKKLEGTERTIVEVEEKYKQANLTIREKEFLVSNLLRSEKALLDCAFELRSGLDSAASDCSGLFSKIERKDKTEEGNKVLVQNFRVYLDQQLKSLHETVSASVLLQETQMKKMEEDVLSFLSSKTEVAEEFRGRVEKLTDAFGAGIGLLSDLCTEMDRKSLKILDEVNDQVSDHFSALADWFKKTVFVANQLLNELKSELHIQEEKLLAFSEQLHAGFLRNLEHTQSISNTTTGFFKSLEVHASNLIAILEETKTSQERKLLELEMKFEECAAIEEKELIEKISAMLASSSTRKKKLVQESVYSLRENAVTRSSKLREEVKTARDFTSEVKKEWASYVEQTEKYYREDIASVRLESSTMQDRIRDCVAKTLMGSEQWIEAQDSILALGKGNTESVASIVRRGQEANLQLRSKLSSSASSVGDDAHAATKDILSSIDYNLKLDHGAWRNISGVLGPCQDQLQELRTGHDLTVMDINAEAGKCLEEEYLVYEPSCCTPRRRDFTPPSIQSIEELRTQPFEDLLREFREVKSALKIANGDSKHLHDVYENSQETMTIRDSRPPLVALN